MVFPIGLIISAAASLYGAKQKKKAQEAQLNQYNQALGAQQQQSFLNDAYRTQALRQQQLALGDIRKGYGDALSSVSAVGAEGYRQIADQGAINRSLATQTAYGRGLYNTTAGQSLEAQTAYQTQRAQGGLAERLGALRANLQAGQGAALAGARTGIGAGFNNLAAGGSADTASLIELLGSRRDTFDDGLFGNLGQLGALLQYYLNNQGNTGAKTGGAGGFSITAP